MPPKARSTQQPKKAMKPKSVKKPASHYPTSGKLLRSSRQTFNSIAIRGGGVELLRTRLADIETYIRENRKVVNCPKVKSFLRGASSILESAIKSSIGMPSYSEGVTSQYEASPDIPTMPLDGYQLIQRFCTITKLASSGTTAGGFYADLIATDLKNYTTNQYYRIRKVTSWTSQRADNTGNTSFAGVSVPVQYGTSGTEVMPIWSENRTPIGRGFSGIVTTFPLGNFPLYSDLDNTIILSHFTSLGGTGGITGIPVVFIVEIEALI